MPVSHFSPARRGFFLDEPQQVCFAPPCRYQRDIAPPPMMRGLFGNESGNVDMKESDGKVEFTVNVEGCKPEDLDLKVHNGVVSLKATSQEVDDAGNVVSRRQFAQSFSLPANCDAEAVKSILSKDGVLKIVAPKKGDEAVESAKEQEKIDHVEAEVVQDQKSTEESKGSSESPAEDKEEEIMEVEPEQPEPEKAPVQPATEPELVELVSVAIEGYNPEDLTVAVTATGDLEVRGDHEERSEDGATVVSSRQFSKTVSIPEDVDPDTVRSSLSKKGILHVMAERRR